MIKTQKYFDLNTYRCSCDESYVGQTKRNNSIRAEKYQNVDQSTVSVIHTSETWHRHVCIVSLTRM